MKRLLFIFITLLLLVAQVFGQDYTANTMSTKNTTTTVLDSAGVYTGTAELLRGYNSISITIRADQSGTYKVLFGNTSTITTANAVKTYSFSYTANDTLHTKTIGTDAPYVKVVFTSSGVVAQTKFYLITMLNRGDVLPRTTTGKVDVADATVETTLTNIEADADSTVDMVTSMNTSLDNIEADADSTVDKVTTMDASLNNIEADADSTVDKVTTMDTSLNNIEADADSTVDKVTEIDNNTDLVEAKLDSIDASSTRIEGHSHPSTISLGAATTVSTEVDTTTFTGTTWQTFGAFALDDSLEIALKGDFSDAKPIYPYTQYTFEKFSPVTFPKGYIRRLGGAGTVNYVPIIKGY